VQQNAMGLLAGSSAGRRVDRHPILSSEHLAPVSGLNSNQGGNIVEVYVQGYSLPPLGPILRNPAPLSLGAQSFDRMEGSPGGVPPAR
jgi:hypothetical protein